MPKPSLDHTIGFGPLKVRKSSKMGPFLVYAKVIRKRRVPAIVIGRSAWPKRFGGKGGGKMGFDLTSGSNAWIKQATFMHNFYRFYNYPLKLSSAGPSTFGPSIVSQTNRRLAYPCFLRFRIYTELNFSCSSNSRRRCHRMYQAKIS